MKNTQTVMAVLLVAALTLAPGVCEAKKLKPKFYKDCYKDYTALRKAVPKPSVDVEKTAKTIGTVANMAGRFGGFGGSFGSIATTASTVAQYSETIADVAAFTESMSTSFPDPSARYVAYGERMKTEATDMQSVADFAIGSQECYASAYTDLKQGVENGEIKKGEAKKRYKEITIGVANVSELLAHSTIYMNNNIGAYNQAMTQETTGAGFDLDKMLSLATEAQGLATQVDGLTPGSGDGWAGTGWTASEARIESHRQAMALQYEAAGIANPYPAPALASTASAIGGFGSLTSLASLGSISPAVAAQVALSEGVTQANLSAAGYETEAAPAPGADPRVAALIEAGADMQPYLDAYNRIQALAGMQQGVAVLVGNRPY